MYLTECNDKRQGNPADQDMRTMGAIYNTTETFNPLYNNTAEQSQISDAKRPSESLQAVPQEDFTFTNVTHANCERSLSRHGALTTTHSHHVSGTGRQSDGDMVRSSACNTHSQQHKNGFSYSRQLSKPSITISQSQSLPSMLWDAETYPSWGYHYQSDSAAYQTADQNYGLHPDGPYPGPIDSFTPFLQDCPPTPAETIRGEIISQKSSLTSKKPQGNSPFACKLELEPQCGASSLVTSSVTKLCTAVDELKDHNILLTPPSEGAIEPGDFIAQPDNLLLLKNPENSRIKQDGNCYNKSPVPAVEDDSDLKFLSNDWDLSNFDFLDDARAYAPGFMPDQTVGWGSRQEELPSAYPTLPLDSIFASGPGTGPSYLPTNSQFASDLSLKAPFDQQGGYELGQDYTFGSMAFQDQIHDFNTNIFGSQPATTITTSNDRTSNRSRSKDRLLVDLKRQGHSYKDIKVMGNFEEAESTLRGRYRTLTKPKEQRVRKPEWGDREVCLTSNPFQRQELMLRRFDSYSKPSTPIPTRCTTTTI